MSARATIAARWRVLLAGLGLAAAGIPAAAATDTVPGAPPPASSATAPDLAYGAYQRGHYLTAFKEAALRLQRNPADAAAMTLLGELFNQGLGVRESATEAAGWYRLAARHGDRHAMATLGLMASDGRGMPADRAEARRWLEKAAAAGEPTAAYNLARLLIEPGREAEMARGVELLRIAAAAEIGDAQHALGVLHARGLGGLAPDPAEAAGLYRRAARNGSIAGTVEFAIAQFNGDGVPRDEAGAARQFRRAAAQGNAIAQNRLARLHVLGRGVPKNLVEAAGWHLAASAQGRDDPWLDEALKLLPPADRTRAEALAAARAGRL